MLVFVFTSMFVFAFVFDFVFTCLLFGVLLVLEYPGLCFMEGGLAPDYHQGGKDACICLCLCMYFVVVFASTLGPG